MVFFFLVFCLFVCFEVVGDDWFFVDLYSLSPASSDPSKAEQLFSTPAPTNVVASSPFFLVCVLLLMVMFIVHLHQPSADGSRRSPPTRNESKVSAAAAVPPQPTSAPQGPPWK